MSRLLPAAHHLPHPNGRARVRASRQRRARRAGDIVIFPHGDEHFLSVGSPAKPVDSFRTRATSLDGGLKLAKYGCERGSFAATWSANHALASCFWLFCRN